VVAKALALAQRGCEVNINITVPDWAIVLVIGVWLLRLFFRACIRLGEYFDKVDPIEEPGKNPPPSGPRPSEPAPPQRPA
jgi:hypothetical protein